ncbi:ArsR/SmtB family transcription factor [Actinophytocola sp.]|uniref:ArsR/SmtB family transcription factor n=1 Tax=Actinophytocola sp. TaxID=1872138 RepID=UPI003D6C1D80
MTELPPRRKVRDVEIMGALAHPLRAALLRYLMAVGPRTASECADAVGSTASNCSWHLRQLAKFGLVEATGGGDGRQRPWRASVVGIDLGEFADDPATRAAQLAVFGTALGEEQKLTQRFLERVDELDADWRRASALNGYTLTLTASELADLVAKVDALVRPYASTIREDAPPGAKPVYAGFRAFLRLER